MVTCPVVAQYVAESGPVLALITAVVVAMAFREFKLTAAARGWSAERNEGRRRACPAPLAALRGT